MTAVLLATYVDDSLRVYLRDDDGQLRQLSQSTTLDYLPDPVRLATLVSDLAGELGWTRNGVATVDREVLPAPTVATVAGELVDAEPPPPRRRGRSARPSHAARREQLVQLVVDAGRPLTARDFADVFGAHLIKTGALYSMLATCVRHGLLVREETDEGKLQWRLP